MHSCLLFGYRFSWSAPLPLMVALTFSLTTANAQFVQQGTKLVGSGVVLAVSGVFQGDAVALSADGNTAIVGGWVDSNETGAAWVFNRTNGVWSQQGGKLVGTGASANARQGMSVSLSSDGNTAMVGGVLDSNSTGAAWIYTRNAGVWSQQGGKLVGTGSIGRTLQGCSVSLSADGNTALVGGNLDDSLAGAVWVFTRTAGVWSQQGAKLVGAGAVGRALQGCSVSLSADGNTALVGGYEDSGDHGAAWVFSRSAGVWEQQGSKLVGTGAVGAARQGNSVSLSADGNTAIVGGYADNTLTGAVWVFTRTGNVWSQQGSKLVGAGAENGALGSFHGYSVSLSGDGNTAIVGGYADSNFTGAAWVYTRTVGVWSQMGDKLVGTGATGKAEQGVSVSLSTDGNTAVVGGFADDNFMGAAWVYTREVSGAPDAAENGPLQSRLEQNYPNPFNPTTSIRYSVPERSHVSLTVFNILGQQVATLVQGEAESGFHEVTLDASGLSSGVYLYRLQAGDVVLTRKLVVLR